MDERRSYPVLRVLQWALILVGLAWIGVSLVLVARGLERAQGERQRQQSEIVALQTAIERANELLTDAGEDPVPVPTSSPIVGERGETGPPGPQGFTGAQGDQGAIGPQGETGTTGKDGSPGATGPSGPAGSDGADGATGPQGNEGPPGPTGPQGPQGPQGPPGLAGAPGPACPDGFTPQSLYVLTAVDPPNVLTHEWKFSTICTS